MKQQTVKDIQLVITEKIPNGLVVPEHTDTAHFYRHTGSGGGLYASVTTKTSALNTGDHLKMWAANMAVEQLAEFLLKNRDALDDAGRLELVKRSAVMAHQNYFEDAGKTGTKGHGAIEDYLNEWINTGIQPHNITQFITPGEEDARVWASSRSAEMFCNEWNVQPIASELLVASKKYKYAGTLDFLCMLVEPTKCGGSMGQPHSFMDTPSGKLLCCHCGLKTQRVFALVDWKTSNSIDKESYAMQVSAYRQALREMSGLKPKVMYIVRLDKQQAKYEVRKIVDADADFKAFVHICNVYDWKNNGAKKLLPVNKKEIITL